MLRNSLNKMVDHSNNRRKDATASDVIGAFVGTMLAIGWVGIVLIFKASLFILFWYLVAGMFE